MTEDFDPTQHPVPDDDVAEKALDQAVHGFSAEDVSGQRIDPDELEPSEETPPSPEFLIVPNRYGPGTTGVYRPDGRPVGIWLSEEYADLTPTQVTELLSALGMEGNLADAFSHHREVRDSTAMEIVDSPALQEFAAMEESREERLKEVRAAFVKAQRKT